MYELYDSGGHDYMELRGSRALRLCPKSGHGFGCLLIGGGSPDKKVGGSKKRLGGREGMEALVCVQ